jgi:8-oxo-dGTP pyrophosphatase MutT (NUDIX family)/GNAT superfamily N-acetyltransferase
MAEVVLITAYDGQGRLLIGKRNDNERYTLPGGHIEPGESPEVAALRELYEETGLHATSLSFLKDYTTAAGVRLHCFSAFVTGRPHGNLDPDQEVEEWEFVDVEEGLPPKVFNNLHGPGPETGDNLVTQLFGLHKAEDDFEPLMKKQLEPGAGYSFEHEDPNTVARPSAWARPGEYMIHGAANHTVRAFHGGKNVGFAHFAFTPDGMVARNVFVDEPHRRKGVASAMYVQAEGKTGRKVVPSKRQTSEGRALWTGNTDEQQFGKREGVFASDEWGTSKISIPSMTHPDRPAYDKGYEQAVKTHYGARLKRTKVSANMLTPVNEVHNQSRYNLYRKMATKDRLPPLVVQRSGSGYRILDGNHKFHGGVAAGQKVFDAFEVPMKKVEFASNDAMLNKRPLGTTCPHGLKMFLVNGEHIRFTVDSDYVQGGNPERYPWIPPGEIWIDESTPRDEIPYVGLHECDEANLMHSHHEGYEQAHDQAKRVEDEHRAEDFGKAEDEVERMLEHPNPAEKTLALKLNSVTPRHLQLAMLDPDPTVHEAAMDHQLFGAAQGLGLMESSTGRDGKYPLAQQMAFLGRKEQVEPYHLAALARNVRMADPEIHRAVVSAIAKHPNASDTLLRSLYSDPATPYSARMDVVGHEHAPIDVLEHAVTTGTTVPSVEARDLARKAIEHVRFSPETITQLVMQACGRPELMPIAERGLETHSTHPDLYSHLFAQARMKPTGGAARLLGALMRGPSSTPEHAADIATRIPLEGLPEALQGPHVRPEHLDRVVAYARSTQNKAMLDKLLDNPSFGPRHFEQLLVKTEPLSKAIKTEHFKGVVRALDKNGPKMVDHTPDLTAHPESHAPEVEAYHNHVLNHPKSIRPKAGGIALTENGVTRKKIFHAQVPGQNEPGKFMVKPYHEHLIRAARGFQKYPIQGWAEMTNQALFHAGGIGHLHQKVHVAEHDMGPGHEKEPALVVSLAPNHTQADDVDEYNDSYSNDLRKIAMMDFLSNNQDRHGGNLMFNSTTGSPLAVDNSRNFQYIAPHRHCGGGADNFGKYVRGSAIGSADPLLGRTLTMQGKRHEAEQKLMENYSPVFDWWGQVGGKIRDEFHRRLGQIKDPEARAHLKRNFDARADYLDDRAKFGIDNFGSQWYNDPVDMYKPGQLTDEEQEEKQRNERAA